VSYFRLPFSQQENLLPIKIQEIRDVNIVHRAKVDNLDLFREIPFFKSPFVSFLVTVMIKGK
jgi:hypothetical protein